MIEKPRAARQIRMLTDRPGIYAYNDDHPIGGKGYDPANFDGSFYSATKSKTEELPKPYPNTLILRLRMLVSDDLHPRSFRYQDHAIRACH